MASFKDKLEGQVVVLAASGATTVTHNYGLPLGPGNAYRIEARLIQGSGYLQTITASALTFFADVADTHFRLHNPDDVSSEGYTTSW